MEGSMKPDHGNFVINCIVVPGLFITNIATILVVFIALDYWKDEVKHLKEVIHDVRQERDDNQRQAVKLGYATWEVSDDGHSIHWKMKQDDERRNFPKNP